jgi:AbrB family looped-hinge helix DNA binding protein
METDIFLCKKVRVYLVLRMTQNEKAELTILSEKGQVVIPAQIRSRLGLEPQTKFLVMNATIQ